MQLREDIILGLDIGIGSVGWAAVQANNDGSFSPVYLPSSNGDSQYALGVRAFDIPENPKTKELLNVARREKRRQRVTIRRRRKRMQKVRNLLVKHGLLRSDDPQQTHYPYRRERPQHDPWQLRQEGLQRMLRNEELAVILIHIAKHRGFKSNSKKDKSLGGGTETGKMLSAVSSLEARIAESGAETVGEYMAGLDRKRNRRGFDDKAVYDNTILRDLLAKEANILFERQRSFGQNNASDALLTSFKEIAFRQEPLKSVEGLIGSCLFEPGEKRAPKHAYTSEKFRLVQRLTVIRLRYPEGRSERIASLKVKELAGTLGTSKGITYKALRNFLKLDSSVLFEGLDYGKKDKAGKEVDAEKSDIVTRTRACAEGSHTFYKVLGKNIYSGFVEKYTENGQRVIDAASRIISVNDDLQKISEELANLPLPEQEVRLLTEAVHEGRFSHFRGTMNLSLKAMQNILPHMIEEQDYAAGCEASGYDHAKTRPVNPDAIRNPVVRRILKEVRKQFRAVIRELGVIPGRVHIELLRDMGKSAEERNEIENSIKRRTAEKKQAREDFASLVHKRPEDISVTELMRYELWKEQGGKCAYWILWRHCGGGRHYTAGHMPEGSIALTSLLDEYNQVQIDHILPRSRTFDNSFHNLCLCSTAANQAKGNLTPWEWLGRDNPEAWHEYEAWIRSLRIKGLKKRNYTLKNLDQDREGRFHERNLTDSRYAARLVLAWFAEEYENLGVDDHDLEGCAINRFRSRPGQLTSILRQSWGVNGLKYDDMKQRVGDRHHALDALVVACCTESTLQKMTQLYKLMEHHQEKYRLTPQIPAPWDNFRNDAARMLRNVFVSRAERGNTKGALHEETLRQVRVEIDDNGNEREIVYERVAIKDLNENDLVRIKDAERNKWLIDILRAWIAAGKPKGTPPSSPKGDPIRKVRLRRGAFTSGIKVARGEGLAQADNAKMVRTDVFTKDGKYYLIPVYTSQIARGEAPNRAVVANKPESEWTLIDDTFSYLFSMTPNSYIVTEDRKGLIREGYFTSTDRTTAAITLRQANDHTKEIRSGTKTLKLFQKYRVDRLGRLYRVRKEVRP
jgi:CRISPR-associated endonuclease Csn1